MSLATALRETYTLDQIESLQGLAIDEAARQAAEEYFSHVEQARTTAPSLSRFAGLVVVRSSLEMLNEHPELQVPAMNKAGYMDAVTVSAIALSRTALLPQNAHLARELEAMYPEGNDEETIERRTHTEWAILNAMNSTAQRQANGSGTAAVRMDWSSQFPLLHRLRNGVDRPTPWHGDLDYRQGYDEGAEFFPATIAAYALGEELREQFGDLRIDPEAE